MIEQVCTFFSSSNQLVCHCNMALQIKDIKEKLAAIAADRHFHLEVHRADAKVVSRARDQTHCFIPQEEVIGKEDDKMAILELLLDPNVEENVLVLAAVGCGGLGKTILAQLVFNDEKVQKRILI